jgi:tripeptide aminopeptidase
LITTDGKTLLGADDKAGIAEIMAALEILVKHPEMAHGTVKVCFTPDEEIGRGVLNFDYETFDADFAYTIDGGAVGSITYENFNAASAVVRVKGRSIHPGDAKNKMVNAARVAIEYDGMLPVQEKPEYTEQREGFFHLHSFNGSVEEAQLTYIIRDHDKQKFEQKKALAAAAAEYLNHKHGPNTVAVELIDSYYNMREKIEPVMHVVETAMEAMQLLGIEPKVTPIRGGTDGAHMSYHGLPTPNLFTGGYNAHGRYEFAVVEEMEQSVQTILKIIELYATRN